ncbi:chorismate lyase [Pseudomonas sp. Milli4]|uniref:Probable chorismate pyruvate-lyase n=1 Tax=Pseudomonas schmalbachii TaxID=2816993 RepID=A0ABS3TUI9_9PSED|nr:chorismate lyase [Pseudomonas schmalbachii]
MQPCPSCKTGRPRGHAKLRASTRPASITVPDAALIHPPRWLTAAQLHPAPPASVLDWLFDQGSLTRRLTAQSDGTFAVEPLAEGWHRLRPDECAALGVADGSQGWVREVYLHGRGQPWVFARSVAARSALEGSGFDLSLLGSRSLGELLFSDRAFHRGAIEVCRYPAACLPPTVRSERLWGRRSCFSRGSLGVLVAEVFLPAFWQQLDAV